MRRVIGAALAIGLLCGGRAAAAETPTLGEKYLRTMQIFRGGGSTAFAALTAFPHAILDGIEGDWFDSFLLEGRDDKVLAEADVGGMSITSRTCSPPARTKIWRDGEDAFVVTRGANRGDPVMTTYTNMSYNLFGVSTPPGQLYAAYGFDRMQEGNSRTTAMASARSSLNGTAAVFRPYPDVLVIVLNGTDTRIWFRCP